MDSAFSGCDGLKTVYFLGSGTFDGTEAEEWASYAENRIGMESKDLEANGYGNTYLVGAQICYYSDRRIADGAHWHFNDKKEPELWT